MATPVTKRSALTRELNSTEFDGNMEAIIENQTRSLNNEESISAISQGAGTPFDTLADAMISPLADGQPFFTKVSDKGQYFYDSTTTEGYVLDHLFTENASEGEVLEGSDKYFNGNKTHTQIKAEITDKLRNDECQFNNLFSDNSFDVGLFEKVSGVGSFEYIDYNNIKVLHASNCIIKAEIPLSSLVDLSKNWSFTMFVNSLTLNSTNSRIIAQVLKSNNTGTGDKFEIYKTENATDVTIFSDNYVFDSLAEKLQIYIDVTDAELHCSNFFIGNAPYAKFVPYDENKSEIETVKATAVSQKVLIDTNKTSIENGLGDYVNFIPDNIFQKDISYFENQPNTTKFNVNLEKVQFDNDYSKYSLKATGEHSTPSNNFIGIYEDVTALIRPGDTVIFKGLVFPEGEGVFIERRFRDISDGTLITLSDIDLVANEWNYVEFEEVVPTDTVYANFFVRGIAQGESIYISAWDLHKKNTISKHKINNPISEESSSSVTSTYSTVELDVVNGNDSNTGLIGSPVQSFTQAVSLVSDFINPTIIIRNGDYYGGLNFNLFTKRGAMVKLIAPVGETVRFLGTVALNPSVKTSGFNNIYESSCSYTIPVHGSHLNKRIVFEDGNQSKEILEAERHPLQKGLTHRLPYSELIEVDFNTDLATTLANLDAEANGGCYYDTTNNKMYVLSANQSNPNTNGFTYAFTNKVLTTAPDLDKYLSIEIDNIQFCYSRGYGLDTSNFVSVKRNKCSVFGALSDGFKDDSNILESWNEESAGCGNDGQNGHFNNLTGWDSTNLRSGTNLAKYFNSWGHDNYDDGMSFHERGQVFTYGGLYEYNWDRGIAPSGSCIMECHNPYIRRNGQGVGIDSGAVGIGFSSIGSVITGDDKGQTTAIVYGGIIENNTIGIGVESSSAGKVIAVNTITRENTSSNYMADEGEIEAHNCKSTHSLGLHKVPLNGGIITVVNDDNLA